MDDDLTGKEFRRHGMQALARYFPAESWPMEIAPKNHATEKSIPILIVEFVRLTANQPRRNGGKEKMILASVKRVAPADMK